MLESEQVVNNVSLAGFHSEETDIHGKVAAHKTGNHKKKNRGTLQSPAEGFTSIK